MLARYMASYGCGQTVTLWKATMSCIKPGKTDGVDTMVTIRSLASFGDSFALKVKKVDARVYLVMARINSSLLRVFYPSRASR